MGSLGNARVQTNKGGRGEGSRVLLGVLWHYTELMQELTPNGNCCLFKDQGLTNGDPRKRTTHLSVVVKALGWYLGGHGFEPH